jgi:sulfur-carrier protein
MAKITVSVPRMLTSFTDGKRRFNVEAVTVAGALVAAEKAYPMLRIHLFDETGGVREHVQIFVNSTDCRDLPSLREPVKDGDEIIVLQAISGGVTCPVAPTLTLPLAGEGNASGGVPAPA